MLDDGYTLLAPDLIVPEVCNVACTKLRRGEVAVEQAGAMIDGLADLIGEIVPSIHLAGRAFEIAGSLAHPAYDCFYLALAQLRGVPFVTADTRFLGRLAGTTWAGLAHNLESTQTSLR